MKTCRFCGAENEENNKFCSQCGGQFETDASVPPEETGSSAAALPMRWHKFLTVMLLIGAAVSVLAGVSMFPGKGLNIAGTEGWFSGLQAAWEWSYPVYGVLCIALGIYMVTVRKRLRNYMASGPSSLYVYFGLALAVNLFRFFALGEYRGESGILPGALWYVLYAAVAFRLNRKYYSRRQDLFVN